MSAQYDAIAEWYDAQIRAGELLHALAMPALLDLCGDLIGRTVCDLACGQGAFSRVLATHGATVTGIDLSVRLLAVARRYEASAPLGITYREGDAQRLDAFADGCFDGVTCSLALMDIPDLAATLASVARVLVPGGWFAFAVTHPCFETPHAYWITGPDGARSRAVRGYFAEGEWWSAHSGGVRGRVGAQHRTLSTYLNALTTAGFSLIQTDEPAATDDLAARLPGYREVPALFLARCRRKTGADC